MEFHEKLQQLRTQRNLTQEELAQALYVSRTAVSKWESGRGYPNIDSLKAIAKFFMISVDDLLSSDELLTIAKQKESRVCDLTFGLLDVSTAALFFLPFFGQRVGGIAHSVSLLSLVGISAWVKPVYIAIVAVSVVWGILTLALQNSEQPLWVNNKARGSLLLTILGALLLAIGLHPYAASLLLILTAIKAFILIKR